MSIFPTKILLATDGSKEARLALTTAADMAQSTNSELHVAYVFPTAVQRPSPTLLPPDRGKSKNTSSRKPCSRLSNSSTSR